MKERTALLFLLPLAIFVAGCSRQPGLFSEQNARAHIEMLAGTIGGRPIGSPANARARAYITDQLRLFGFDVRVQASANELAAASVTALSTAARSLRPACAVASRTDRSTAPGPSSCDRQPASVPMSSM